MKNNLTNFFPLLFKGSFNFITLFLFMACQGIAPLYAAQQASLPSQPRPVVAVTQIAPHPSLDLIRKGIEDELKDQKAECDIHFENAQGNITLATQIAQKFASQNPAVIVPITTPSAQAVYAASLPQKIPVVFAAVSDPVAAKLTPTLHSAGQGITGISDLSPVEAQVALIRKLVPAAKKIGVVYNAGESNSTALLERFEKVLAQNGLTVLKVSVTNTTEVATAAKSLIGKVDVFYVPNDNTVVAALESLLNVAQENKPKIPVFCADPESVKKGCIAAIAHNQYKLGREAGKIVARVLRGDNIQDIPVENPASTIELTVNQAAAKEAGIIIPENLETLINYTATECPVHLDTAARMKD